MAERNPFLLDALPDAALLISQGQLTAANAMARHYLSLPEGPAPLPSYIPLVSGVPTQSGTFSNGLSRYSFRFTQTEEGDLLLFHPAPQTALSDTQLDGALRQMRTFLNEILVEVEGQPLQNPGSFHKTFHRMFRLMDNLEFCRAAGSGEGPSFHPVTVDLAGLCRQVVSEAGSLLRDSGITLNFQSNLPTLLIPGDPQLLQRLLLELVSNSVRSMGKGAITLSLRSQGGRAMLLLTDSGSPLTDRKLTAMLQQDTDQLLPLPEAGAGLGLSIARQIVDLHGGALLIPAGVPFPTVVLALPTGPLDPHVPVKTPAVQRDGGLSPMLVALSDVLPADLFRLVELD